MADATDSGQPPAGDDLYRSMNRWELATRSGLAARYGHSPEAAASIASMLRWEIETGLRRPVPLFIVTGI